jgi:glycosyltransferase involved in cell wall biosynthesis
VIGFRRGDHVPDSVSGAAVVDLGRTRDAKLAQRAAKVIENLMRPSTMIAAAHGADVVIGRNLESLILAARVRRGLPNARLVYECLDIHRTLMGRSLPARVIQHVEARLLAAIDLLIVSSPAFVRDYFSTRPTLTAPTLLVENKMLALEGPLPLSNPAPPAPPWTIGWFGNLRCARTFEYLSRLARDMEGRVTILIAGRASPAVFDDFPAMVEAAPHCTYTGPFTVADLPELYSRCHFAWAIDYFEEGLNSRWLLPNRLYEASSFGAVPIALRSVETGHWLARHGAGLLLDDDDPVEQMRSALLHMDAADYAAMRGKIRAISKDELVDDADDAVALLQAVVGR